MKNLVNVLILSLFISIASAFAYDPPSKTLLVFGADWCKYCAEAKYDINNDSRVREVIKNYEVVFVDYDVDKDLVDGYNIKTLPTFVILDGTKESGRKVGYNGGSRGLYKFLK